MELFDEYLSIENLYELGLSKSDIVKELKIIKDKLTDGKLRSFRVKDIDFYISNSSLGSIMGHMDKLDVLIYGLEFTTNVNRSGRKYKEPTLEQLDIIRENHGKWLNGHISWNDYYKLVGVANNTLKRWLVDRGYKLR